MIEELNLSRPQTNEDSCAELQGFCLPRPPGPEALYLRGVAGSIAIEGESFRLAAGAAVSFDTYFNSFYEAFWLEHTCVSEVGLRLQGSGRARCIVTRETLNGERVLAADRSVELGRSSRRIDLEPSTEPGRLFLELRAETPVVIASGAWTTRDPPLRDVRLGVGACTFNRQDLLVRTAEALLNASTLR